MKFLLFADLHYFPEVFYKASREDITEIQQAALREGCDFIIHAGDFCHGPTQAHTVEAVRAYNEFSIPSYHCLGNHDADRSTYEETIAAYNMPDGHYFFDCKGYRIIVLNPNFFKLGEEYIHYSQGNYFGHAAARDWVPPEQLAWLEETIAAAPHPCILISHESFERSDGVQNRQQVLDIINRANAKRPNSVLMCINGHHHRDHLRILDNVAYFEVNSSVFEYVPNRHPLYPDELNKA
ncbi:MAG: metallophosphoesterase, partial [Clostridia bacterium]|nr:metallophosphoesterase [Clostridia bacterium]